ncbi:MAG TPA: hypothetical protein VMT52_04575 [Planctomycetota bacterium]|nr:hypothetical protein [Planctomycetota bacterium]
MSFRPLNQREKRTLRIGASALCLYLLVFYGLEGWRLLEGRRAEYDRLSSEAGTLELEMLREKVKAQRLEKLRRAYRLDPANLREDTVVGAASAAIQKSAQSLGLQLGPSKEAPGRIAGKDLAVLQIEGSGPTPAAARFVHSIGTLGYPLVVDSILWKTTGMKPGQVRLSLGVVVLHPGALAKPGGDPAGSPAKEEAGRG